MNKQMQVKVNHVTRSGRFYQPQKERELIKGKEVAKESDPALVGEEDDVVLK